jgi:phosphoribosylformimino-5-aminoimidazole carboxamide ribotide isomerase
MILVIPSIEIKKGIAVRTPNPNCDDFVFNPDNTSELALLWRKENAKTIHVTDYDGIYEGDLFNFNEICELTKNVEIPIELLSKFEDVEECRRWLKNGIYRIVVHDLFLKDPVGVHNLINEFGSSRVCAGAITRNGYLSNVWRNVEPITTLMFSNKVVEIGAKRIFFTDRDREGTLMGANLDEITIISSNTNLKITVAGGVASPENLWDIQKLETSNVDSVVIGRALCENKFPCQKLWRDIEAKKRRDGLEEKVSTSDLKK